jgi:hypothetical protein
MKQIKSIMFFFFFVLGLLTTAFSQVLMPEVVISAMRYKYLSSVDNRELPQPVRILEHQAASYDVKNSEYYDDEYEEYNISFYLPAGYVLATYNKDGKLLRTAERFKNVALPESVAQSLVKRYPHWDIPKDVYRVTYEDDKGATKVWKVLLKQGEKRLKVKLDDEGEFTTKL